MTDAIVATRHGQVGTRRTEPVLNFRGIPYAAPPDGARRFLPPAPPVRWDGVRDASHYGPTAAQPPSPLETAMGAKPLPMSEADCLTLNVWTPAADDGGRPVMVWIHGGAFVAGTGATP